MVKPYALVALLLLLIFLPGCLTLKQAYIPDQLLTEGWHENKGETEEGSNYFGLEKWYSITYENGESASLTVTTIKTLIMMDKTDLLKKADEEMFGAASLYSITIDRSSKREGDRILGNGHESSYIIYNGTKEGKTYRMIGEVWSCTQSGVSIICMGLTDLSSVNGMINWEKIVGDPKGNIDEIDRSDGLIYNVKCH